MIEYKYEVERSVNLSVYHFDSIGVKGVIRKVIQFTKIDVHDFYNLGFGDKIIDTNLIDDLVVTNNGDAQKVLATVAFVLIEFININPQAKILILGSTIARTRLYRIAIANSFAKIEKLFIVYGLENDKWSTFKKEVTYKAFLVVRKNQ